MAILKLAKNEVEVRIRREPDGDYLEEFVTLHDREQPNAQTCERYIIAKPGITFAIEATLRKGYNFGKCEMVTVLGFANGGKQEVAQGKILKDEESPVATEDLKTIVSKTDLRVGGKGLIGAGFAYRTLDIVKVEEFRQSVGTVTTQPKDIGVLVVEIHRILQEKQLSHQEYLTHVKVAELKRLRSPQNIPENPTAIDEVSCNENGIESGIELVGGTVQDVAPPKSVLFMENAQSLKFVFIGRSENFLEKANIVPYPAPLHLYDWTLLSNAERKNALRKLQEIHKGLFNPAFKANQVAKNRRLGLPSKESDRPEWRPWNQMNDNQRRNAFETLQKANRDFEHRDVQQPELIETSSDDDEPIAKRHKVNPVNKATTIETSSEDDQPLAKRYKFKPARKATTTEKGSIEIDDDESSEEDDELERMREREMELTMEIDELERLRRMKRERDILRAKIEDAEVRKVAK